ncbi:MULTISPECIES: toll/interleukin-1 receptor domain-containing protein [Cerasicoccaceae]|uniref:toll/interleukin-1 receptor domain-containing protein n=1 Tax=Cerasicoccaceae TaxID=3056374 RepID=UPI001C7357BE|nr:MULTISPECIES: toll/interleukin-1 receptor domain-containing protein [Cerasicoccaceae]QYY35455.1 toll/interleukin-1 receptor domain-containing protein [Ruficoccus sp. ZRK36]
MDGKAAPRVFISYSHDSPEHKQWVSEFVTELRLSHGVDAILDQLHLGPGDDFVYFMREAIGKAEWILIVCTDPYIEKANSRTGGAGYETIIVEGELIRDLKTKKFIPIYRLSDGSCRAPDSLSTRFGVNFHNSVDREEAFRQLVNCLHGIPPDIPPVGGGPKPKKSNAITSPTTVKPVQVSPNYTKEPPGQIDVLQPYSKEPPGVIPVFPEPSDATGEFYEDALNYATIGNRTIWRRQLDSRIKIAFMKLFELRESWDRAQYTQEDWEPESFPQIAFESLAVFKEVFCMGLAGIEAANQGFNRQTSLIQELVDPPDWDWAGSVVTRSIPELLVFCFQALAGAMSVKSEQPHIIFGMANLPVSRRFQSDSTTLWQQTNHIGWPETLGRNCVNAWNFLMRLHAEVEWISKIFDGKSLKGLVCAHYALLSVNEFLHFLDEKPNLETYHHGIPTMFLGHDNLERGLQYLYRSKVEIRECILSGHDIRKLNEYWIVWVKRSLDYYAKLNRIGIYRDARLGGFKDLLPNLLS